MKKKWLLFLIGGIVIVGALVASYFLFFNQRKLILSEAKIYDYGNEVLKEDLYIQKDQTILKNVTVKGDVYVEESVGEGHIEFLNVIVEGIVYVNGGGVETLYLNDSEISNMECNKDVRIELDGGSIIDDLEVTFPNAILQTDDEDSIFNDVIVNILEAADEDVMIFDGYFEKLSIVAGMNSIFEDGTDIKIFSVGVNGGKGNSYTIRNNARIRTANVNGEAYFEGEGTIEQLRLEGDGVVVNCNYDSIEYNDNVKNYMIGEEEILTPNDENYVPTFIGNPYITVSNAGIYEAHATSAVVGTVYYTIVPYEGSNYEPTADDVKSGKGIDMQCGNVAMCPGVAGRGSFEVSSGTAGSKGGHMGEVAGVSYPSASDIASANTLGNVRWMVIASFVIEDEDGNFSEVYSYLYE